MPFCYLLNICMPIIFNTTIKITRGKKLISPIQYTRRPQSKKSHANSSPLWKHANLPCTQSLRQHSRAILATDWDESWASQTTIAAIHAGPLTSLPTIHTPISDVWIQVAAGFYDVAEREGNIRNIDGLVQDCSSISNALAMEILQSCTKPSIESLLASQENITIKYASQQ